MSAGLVRGPTLPPEGGHPVESKQALGVDFDVAFDVVQAAEVVLSVPAGPPPIGVLRAGPLRVLLPALRGFPPCARRSSKVG